MGVRRQWVSGGVDLNTGDYFHGNRPKTRCRYAYASHFVTSMTMRLWITVSTSSTWRLVSTRKRYHTRPLVGVQGNLEAPIRSDVPTYAIVRRWVHMAKKATWRGMHVCGVFWLLSPSPSLNPEVHNKQTEVRLLMSIMWGEIVNKWTFLRKLRDSKWNGEIDTEM